jgi:hypothetical protein
VTGRVTRHDAHAQWTNLEPIPLRRSTTGDDFQGDVGRSAADDGPVAAGSPVQGPTQTARCEQLSLGVTPHGQNSTAGETIAAVAKDK